MKNVLVIAAHPDDEVLGCGATMARHVAAGVREVEFLGFPSNRSLYFNGGRSYFNPINARSVGQRDSLL